MYVILTLFFLSLIGIIIMIGRKLAPVRNGQVVAEEHPHPFVPDWEKMKHVTYKGIRKYEHVALVILLRFYVLLANFLKREFLELKGKVKKLLTKDKDGMNGEEDRRESSKFLKVISEYKHRIRRIKHKIKEEEGIE